MRTFFRSLVPSCHVYYVFYFFFPLIFFLEVIVSPSYFNALFIHICCGKVPNFVYFRQRSECVFVLGKVVYSSHFANQNLSVDLLLLFMIESQLKIEEAR